LTLELLLIASPFSKISKQRILQDIMYVLAKGKVYHQHPLVIRSLTKAFAKASDIAYKNIEEKVENEKDRDSLRKYYDTLTDNERQSRQSAYLSLSLA
jgi:hypothetical protein